MSNNSLLFLTNVFINDEILFLFDPKLVVKNQAMIALLTLSCSANERTEMKLKIYLSEAWMCSEFGYQRLMSNKKGLNLENLQVLNVMKIKSLSQLKIIHLSSS